MPNKLVSLCVLNTNERHFLEKAIPLMLGQTYQPLELIVVDNASEDGSAEWIEKNYPEVVLLRNERNLFYCKSHNKGIAAAKGEYVMLLNSDIFMTPTFVEEQVRAMEADPKVGLCQGKLVQIKREEEPVETRTLGKTLDSCGVGMDVLLRVQDYGFAREDKGQYNARAHVFAACGAVPLYTRAFIEDVACEGEVLDEDYEIYGEDLDIGWRAQLLGWRVLYVPTAVAYHFRGLKTLAKPTPEPIKRYMQGLAHKNRYLIIAKNATWRQFVPWGLALLPFELFKAAVLAYRTPYLMEAYLRAWRQLPSALRKRRIVQGRRRVTGGEIQAMLTYPQRLKDWRQRLIEKFRRLPR